MRQALELALEALIGVRAFLESDAPVEIWGVNDKAITAIKEALAQPEQEPVAVEFEKMTGVPNAWNNPALMQVRNGFIGGWEAAQSKKSENFDTWMKNPYTKTIMESIKNDYQPKKPKNEPVAWYDKDGVITANPIEFSQPLYTTPPQRTWVGLTNDEINNLAAGCHLGNSVQDAIYKAVANLKEKNT